MGRYGDREKLANGDSGSDASQGGACTQEVYGIERENTGDNTRREGRGEYSEVS